MGRDLKLENLTKRYGQLTAVDRVDYLFTGAIMAFLLVILAVSLLHPAVPGFLGMSVNK